MSKILFNDREAWLTEASNLILDDLIMQFCEGYDRPQFRISIGFPKHSRGGKAIAVCFAKAASTDGVNEIFINPEIDDPIKVLEANVHELIHAVDDCQSGHLNFFARTARAVGLEGKLTATFAGDELKARLEGYAELLGQFPHNRMNTSKVHKKDGTRQLKIECGDCGMIFRASRKWAVKAHTCPCCESNNLIKS